MISAPSGRVFRGASAGQAGTRGRVPAPAAGDQNKVLRGDATWGNPPISGETMKGNWNASTNTPALADGVGTAGDAYYVETGATRNLGGGNQTFASGDYVVCSSALVWQKRTQPERVDSVALAAISSAGNTDFAIAAGVRNSSCNVAINAGSAAYLATISLLATNAVAGAIVVLQIAMPASLNPTIEVRNLTSAGTLLGTIYGHPTQARTWIVRARFDGTNWTAAGIQLADRRSAPVVDVQEWVATRTVDPYILSDGASSNRRSFIPPGAAGNVAGMAAHFHAWVDVPSSNPAASAYCFFLAPATTPEGGSQGQSFFVLINSAGLMQVRQNGATSSDYRLLAWGAFRATYSGRRVLLTVDFPAGDSTTPPVIAVDGVDITSSFTPSTANAAPNWMPTTLDCARFVSAFAWPAGRAPRAEYGPGAWSAAEVLTYAQTGVKPSWWVAGTGSTVNKNADPTLNDLAKWGSQSTITRAVSAGLMTLSGAVQFSSITAPVSAGHKPFAPGARIRYRIVVDSISGTGSPLWVLQQGSNVEPLTPLYISTTGTKTGYITARQSDSETHAFNLKYYGTGTGAITISAFELIEEGPIAKTVLQPGCPAGTDSGENRLPLLLTSGMFAVGNKPEVIAIPSQVLTGDTFVLADQTLVPAGYEPFAALVSMTAGTSTGTFTIKKTSSGGTTLFTGTLPGAAGLLSLTPTLVPFSTADKLHASCTSWAGSTELTVRVLCRRVL